MTTFSVWASLRHGRETPDGDRFQHYTAYLMRVNLNLAAKYYSLTHHLRRGLKMAKQNKIKETFEHMHDEASAATILHELKPILGPTNLKKLKMRTLPYVKNSEGEHCQLPNEAIEVWSDFFRQMEGGLRISQKMQREHWLASLQHFQQDQFVIPGDELPSLVDLEAAYRRVRPDKATGPDDIHPRVCSTAPNVLARKTYSQLLKLTTHGQEALQHKGGILCPIWKQKGPKDSCASYRSILISSHTGKCIHRSIRQHQTTLFSKFLQKEQLGGRPRVPVTLGVHIGRSFLRSRKLAGHNVAMLYLDLTEAFYRILRPLVVGGEVEDELIMHVGARLGLSPDLLAELHAHLDEPSALERAGMPFHMQNTIRALHEDTHFQVRGQVDTCRTRLGSRPGDCFADVIFSYLWGRILHRLQGVLHDLGLAEHIEVAKGLNIKEEHAMESPPLQRFLGPTWMDDTCVCVSDPCPLRMERKITQATSTMLALCESHGLSPNLQPGKSEILLVFQGRGSRARKIRFFGPHSDGALTLMGEMETKKVRVVQQYTHLGCVIHHKSDSRKEARRRIGIAQQAFNQHRRALLQNPALSLRRRAELFATLVLSRFCYGTESWTLADNRSKSYVHNTLMRLIRRLLRREHDEHLQDDEILVAANMNSPSELLRLARLRYIGTLYKCKELVPWGLLNQDEAWIALIRDDLSWTWHQLQGASTLPNPEEALHAWQNIWEHHPSYWKRLVKRAGLHARQQRLNHQRVLCFHRRFAQAFHDIPEEATHFDLKQKEEMRPSHADGQPQACMQCKITFRSKGGLGAHLFKVHGVVSKVRLLFDSTCCGACLVEYHTMGKLKAHLLRSGECSAVLWGRRRYFRPADGCGSAHDQQLCQRHDGVLPPLQTMGPRLPDGFREQIPDYDLELAESIYIGLLERQDQGDLQQIVRNVIAAHPVSWDCCRATLDYLMEELTIGDIDALAIEGIDIKELLRTLRHVEAWDFLTPEHAQYRYEALTLGLQDIEERCRVSGDRPSPRSPLWAVPRPMVKERYLIHAFSGRRRPGDFQQFVDRARMQNEGTLIHTISVDIVVDPIWGDVSRPEVRAFWLTAVHDRMVVGAMAGPPCETWSQARGQPPTALPGAPARRAPRVIRDGDELWGRCSLALRELYQLDTGNLLLLFTLELLINLAVEGGIGGLEHPAPPNDETKANSQWCSTCSRGPNLSSLR